MKRLLLFLIAVTLTLGLSACANKKGDEWAGVDGDFVTGNPLPDRIEGANFFGGTVNRGQFQPIYFDFDGYTVPGSENGKLSTVAQAMQGMSNDIIIAGFTDERGTEEYNRGLGELRAQSVRDALISMGVSGSRIQTVSFGKEMPADPGSGEAAWAKNRRAEFGVIR